VGHRILHMPEVETKLTDNLVCGPCVKEYLDSTIAKALKKLGKFVDKQLRSESKDKNMNQSVSAAADAFRSGVKGKNLKDILESQLYSPAVKIEEATVGISTGLHHVSCACNQADHHYSNHHFEIEPVKTKLKFDKKKNKKRSAHVSNHWFEKNNKFVMAVQATGGGGSNAQKFLALWTSPLGQVPLLVANFQQWKQSLDKHSVWWQINPC
jgi:hypothetical protein